jgi:catalase-peroxidase
MAMNDEETVALIAGGHTFGKTHGAGRSERVRRPRTRGRSPRGAGSGMEEQPTAPAAVLTPSRSGLEGAWTTSPVKWRQRLLRQPVRLRVGIVEEPRWSAPMETQGWGRERAPYPTLTIPSKTHAPTMLTTDLALRLDPVYEPISKRFHENHQEFADAFAKAWYKLTHRDMGPYVRGLGALVPSEPQIWQDPVPAVTHELIGAKKTAELKEKILASGLTISELVSTAWASASTFRGTDKRGGANGARIRLAPQKDWDANSPRELAKVLAILEGIQRDFNDSQTGNKLSRWPTSSCWAGCAAVEKRRRTSDTTLSSPSSQAEPTHRKSRLTSSPSPCSSQRRRLSQLPRTRTASNSGRTVVGPSASLDVERSRDDSSARWSASPERQRSTLRTRRLHDSGLNR